MKLTSLLLLVFILCMLQGNAQEFQKRYSNSTNQFLYNSLTALSDTGVALVTVDYMQPQGPHIIKLDQYGDVIREAKFKQGTSSGTTYSLSPSIVEGFDKSITVAYNSAVPGDNSTAGLKILHVDSSLNIVWSKLLPSSNFTQYGNLVKIGTKYYGLNNYLEDSIDTNTNHHYKEGFALCGLNTDGSTIFSNKYFGEETDAAITQSLTSNAANNLIVCAQISNAGANITSNYLRGTIIELDTMGNILRAINTVDVFLSAIIQDENENYILMGVIEKEDAPRYLISMMDKDFNNIWSKILPNRDARDRINSYVENDTIYIFSKHASNGNLQLAITKMDYQGNVIESYNRSELTSLYFSFSKSINGQFLVGDMIHYENNRDYILRSSSNIVNPDFCPGLSICAPVLENYSFQMRNVSVTRLPHSVRDIQMETAATNTTVIPYCPPTGIIDASFVLSKDTFCLDESFDLKSNPQLLNGESIWYITGPDSSVTIGKDVLGIKPNLPGSYSILHIQQLAFCNDSFSRTITVLGGASTVNITTCDTIRAAQISNCPFNWPDGSSDSIYVATNSGTWNISAQCAVCTSNVAVQVTLIPKPYLLEKAADICEGKTLPYTLKGQYISDALWTDGSTGTSYSFDSAGTYPLVLYNNGCMHADTLSVNMIDCRTCDIYLPNAFTPNGDGNNDAFGAYTNCTQIIQFNLQVYNRWGEKVYETNDLNAAWDGTYKGQAAPVATYVYYVSISYNTAADAETKKYKGSVMLIR